ncbi:MAG TPA: hypothetical protein DEG69_05715 [Flavobacteriaceae bacterium]|nr:hypothetical protein [Flavobacteriaceae bacterium]
MREIKFRAWDKINKKMIYRVIVGDTSTDDPCSSIFCDNKKEFLHFDKHCGEIMQYTGRKDKHNKEIYEGDIIGGNYISADNAMGILPNGWTFHKDQDRFLVIWDSERLGWTFDFKKTIPEDVISEFGEYTEAYMCKWKNHARHLLTDEVGEVLGNKYENPALLEGNEIYEEEDNDRTRTHLPQNRPDN